MLNPNVASNIHRATMLRAITLDQCLRERWNLVACQFAASFCMGFDVDDSTCESTVCGFISDVKSIKSHQIMIIFIKKEQFQQTLHN